jgi:hypothetical protein
VLLPGEHLQQETLENREGIPILGQSANTRRVSETGTDMSSSERRMDTAEALEATIARAREMLGPLFDDLAATDRRGQTSRTPPRVRHRLMVLVQEVERMAQDARQGRFEMDHFVVGEVNMALDLLERWRNDPALPLLIASIRNPDEYPHAIMTLAAASHLSDLGNGVGLYVEPGNGRRAADLRIALTAHRHAAIEVKMPRILQQRTSREAITEAGIATILKKALREAGTGAGGQLSSEHPGILLIGGFHLEDRQIAMLKIGARKLLSKRTSCAHIIGIAIMSINVRIDNVVTTEDGRIRHTNDTVIGPGVKYTMAMNPHYTGAVRIDIPRPASQEP